MLISNAFRPDPRALNEARGLSEREYDVTIVAWDRQREKLQNEILGRGIRVFRIHAVQSEYGIGNRQIWRLPLFWIAAYRILRDLNPDILHCHDFDCLPVGLFWGLTRRIPVIYDAREYYAEMCKPRLKGIGGLLLYHLIRYTEIVGARLATAVITVDETLEEIYNHYNKRVVIIGHFPPTEAASRPSSAFLRKQLKLIYVGRLSVDRGILIYIEMLRNLLQENIPAQLILIGVFVPSGDEQIMRQHAIGLEEFIKFHNWVPYDEIPEYLRQADIGLGILAPIARYVAAVPVKLFDYMAAGIPALVSNFPSNAKIVNEAHCGILVDPLSDPAEIAQEISNLWKHPMIGRQMGENGRMAIRDRYNWEKLLEILEELYNSIL